MRMHQNTYIGTTECQEERAVFTMKMTAVSGACIALPGTASRYTCTPGPCQDDDNGGGQDSVIVVDEYDEDAMDIVQMIIENYHSQALVDALAMK